MRAVEQERRKDSGWTLIIALLAVSCASYTPQSATLLRLQYAAVSGEKQGFAVGVTPHLDTDRNDAVFNADLKSVGILALQLVVRNNSRKPLSIKNDDFILRLPGGHEYTPAPLASVAERLESHAGVVGWTVAFGMMGFLLSSAQKDVADNARRGDLKEKQISDTALASQESVRGFLFYLIPDSMNEIKGGELLVRATNQSTGERIQMTLALPDMYKLNVRAAPEE